MNLQSWHNDVKHWNQPTYHEDPKETITLEGQQRRLVDVEKECDPLLSKLLVWVPQLKANVQACLAGTAYQAEHERASLKAGVYNARLSYRSLQTRVQEIRKHKSDMSDWY